MIEKNIPRFCLLLLFAMTSCAGDRSLPTQALPAPDVSFAIISDPHMLAAELRGTGNPFGLYSDYGRKLVGESEDIMQAFVDEIIQSDVKFVLMPGDLTFEGAEKSHRRFADYLRQIEQAGKQVYIVPGNHDIENSLASDYSSGVKTSAPYINSAQFEDIYHDFGFSQAISRDSETLSYLIEPVKGLRILCLDVCIYKEYHSFAGQINSSSLDWINEELTKAKEDGAVIMAMMHHNLIEHFIGFNSYFFSAGYLLINNDDICEQLASSGLKILFTGHFHANDIVKRQFGDYFMYEIETNSLISYPCSYRLLRLKPDRKLEIETNSVKKAIIDNQEKSIVPYSEDLYSNFLETYYVPVILGYYSSDSLFMALCKKPMKEAFKSHYYGDEQVSQDMAKMIDEIKNKPQYEYKAAADIIENLFNDLYPGDRNITIDLISGEVIK